LRRSDCGTLFGVRQIGHDPRPAEGLRSSGDSARLCDAVARNFKSSIVKGRKSVPPVALIGAVSQNTG